MKIHYINILLFALPLNILENIHKKPSITHHTPKIPNTRLLCECELYGPLNYDNDPQMKKVMEIFNKQTQQRFHEYDEHMKKKRQECKDRCDKEIQKIILKDKIEKDLNEKFSSLHTDIKSDAIPTCVCEKSLADKVEKGCLRCGSVLGGGVMPGFGAIGGTALYALNAWKPTAIIAAKEAAEKLGIAAGKIAGEAKGMEIVIFGLETFGVDKLFPEIFKNFVNTKPYTEVTNLSSSILENYRAICTGLNNSNPHAACSQFQIKLGIHKQIRNIISPYGTPDTIAIPNKLDLLLEKATKTAEAKAAQVSSETSSKILTEETDVINTIYMSNQTAIIASIIAILIIVLIMVIIYLILRYRRKKKMKKKLQYIKLLEE
ncbi:hypothetical protein PFTANZ_00442 [Plasmodium falciparum Tanzania (2000708)]|uniref:Surface antigen n=1 Tax=Plasmodium falciparum Tanzania (2000708) TaxID=1036725 RepID=A0A024WET9_PLAFA|nr:hypothetical protein PFTANZ_00442 [Plasmodium falciparum Tanzania (2000708)]